MHTRALIQHASTLLANILDGHLPADKQMEQYFRAERALGGRDRGQIADTVYGCLRRRRFLEYVVAPDAADARALVATYLLAAGGLSARALEEAGARHVGERDARALAERLRSLDQAGLPAVVRAELPDWLYERLVAELGDDETLKLGAALTQAAPLDLRVNTLKADRDTVAARLADEGYPAEPTPWSPIGLRRRERAPLFRTASFTEGLFEVQDEGSQLIALLLEPKRREMVVDFCAGGGGKTLHLGALMANTGTLYAFDVATRRLDNLKPRLKRAGLDNVRTVAIDSETDARVQRLYGKIDRVLVDAPCSGSGTLRRNPDMKWREPDLNKLADTQFAILASAAKLLKPGGRLVYATCSLLRAENDEVVQRFLAANSDFHIVPAAEILARRHVPLADMGEALRLYPHRHHTDGFYAVAMERAAAAGDAAKD